MDQDDMAELGRLRARAYGPTADADMTPADWDRLERLEAAARPAPAPALGGLEETAPVQEPTTPGTQTLAELLTLEDDTEGAPASDPEPVADEEPASRRPRRRMLLWIGSLVVTAAVCVGLTSLATSVRPVAPDTGAQQVATLQPLPDATWAQAFGAEADVDQYEFLGLSLVRSDVGFISFGNNCLAVVPTEAIDASARQINGRGYAGCQAGRFPATVQFEVDEDAPAPLRERYADGSGIRFVADDGVVGVFVAPAKD